MYIRSLFYKLHLMLARDNSPSVSWACLWGNLFRKFCLINSGLLLLFNRLVLSDINQRPLNHFFYWLSRCFLASIICPYHKLLWTLWKCLQFIVRCACFILSNLLSTNYRWRRLFCTHCSANLFLPAHDQGIFWRRGLLISPLETVQVQGLRNPQRFMGRLPAVARLQSVVFIWVVPEINLVPLERLRIRRLPRLQGAEFEFLGLVPVDSLRTFQLGTLVFVRLRRLSVSIRRRFGSRRGSSASQLRWNV